MIDSKLKLRVLFAIASCLVLVLAPLPARAQLGGVVEGTKHGIQKGAHGVQKGVETGAEKTKEGVVAGKNAVTGQDNTPSENRMKPSQTQPGTTYQTQPGTTSTETTTRSTQSESTETGQTGQQRQMPKTAGELPLLALAGWSALSAAGVLRIARRKK
jgi:hypothetical protein